ncbi:DUF2577 domain-containing protein [Tissierella praeacuta]|uniref:DUF2577 domain-containing protein n=1 Tax=Tissierella praeacuta TaxID=43131 RepID=UPI003DA68081
MGDYLLQLIKQAAIEAVEQNSPMMITYGTVIEINPLKIMTEQKVPLSSNVLILTPNVVDTEIEVEIDDEVEEKNLHVHEYRGKKKYKFLRGLKVGEKVILLRVQGGQKYVVWDRSVEL